MTAAEEAEGEEEEGEKGRLFWRLCRVGSREIRFFRIFWMRLQRHCSYWLFIIWPMFFFSRADSQLVITTTLPIFLFSSKIIT